MLQFPQLQNTTFIERLGRFDENYLVQSKYTKLAIAELQSRKTLFARAKGAPPGEVGKEAEEVKISKVKELKVWT